MFGASLVSGFRCNYPNFQTLWFWRFLAQLPLACLILGGVGGWKNVPGDFACIYETSNPLQTVLPRVYLWWCFGMGGSNRAPAQLGKVRVFYARSKALNRKAWINQVWNQQWLYWRAWISSWSEYLGNHAASDVQPSEVWVTTMTPGNPKWNGNSGFWIANNPYSARTKNQTHILGLF